MTDNYITCNSEMSSSAGVTQIRIDQVAGTTHAGSLQSVSRSVRLGGLQNLYAGFFKTKKFYCSGDSACCRHSAAQLFPSFIKPTMRDMKQKVIILGFDGMDPSCCSNTWMRAFFHTSKNWPKRASSLNCKQPIPESSVAWASFQNRRQSGGTNIYDFLTPALRRISRISGCCAGTSEVFMETDPHQNAACRADAQRHPVLGSNRRRGVRTTGSPFRSLIRRRCTRASCCRDCRFPISSAPTARFITGPPTCPISKLVMRKWVQDWKTRVHGDTAKTAIIGPSSPILKAEQEDLKKIPKDQRTIEQQARYEELMGAGYKDLTLDMSIHKISGGVRCFRSGQYGWN